MSEGLDLPTGPGPWERDGRKIFVAEQYEDIGPPVMRYENLDNPETGGDVSNLPRGNWFPAAPSQPARESTAINPAGDVFDMRYAIWAWSCIVSAIESDEKLRDLIAGTVKAQEGDVLSHTIFDPQSGEVTRGKPMTPPAQPAAADGAETQELPDLAVLIALPNAWMIGRKSHSDGRVTYWNPGDEWLGDGFHFPGKASAELRCENINLKSQLAIKHADTRQPPNARPGETWDERAKRFYSGPGERQCRPAADPEMEKAALAAHRAGDSITSEQYIAELKTDTRQPAATELETKLAPESKDGPTAGGLKRVTTGVRDMLAILESDDATEDEKSMAASTIVEAVAPDIMEMACQLSEARAELQRLRGEA